MNIKEFFSSNVMGAAGLGASRFRLSLDKEKAMSPHIIMNEVFDMLERRPSVRSGLSDITRFLLSDIGFFSDDAKSVEFMVEWMKQRPLLHTEIFNFSFTLMAGGTAYSQPSYKRQAKGGQIYDNMRAVPNPGIIYRNMSAKTTDKDYWLMEVPIEVQEFDGQRPIYKAVWYIKGSRFYHKWIWCIRYPMKVYDPMVFGHSRNLPYYGWGLLSSSVDNEDIAIEILKNWALQAKYRALGKKIIGFYNTSDEAVSLQELEDIKKEFQSLEEEDSILVNKRFDQTDLSFTGQDDAMESQIEWLRKDSGSGLVPNYMTAFSQDSSMATAAEAKIPFSLLLKSIQPLIVYYLNDVIIERLRKSYPFLADDLTFTLGMPELYSRDEVFTMMLQLYNQRAATFNELRIASGLEPVKGGDVWGEEPPLDSSANAALLRNETPEAITEKMKKMKKSLKEHLVKSKPKEIDNKSLVEKVNIPKKGAKNDKKLKLEALREATKNLLS